MKKALYFIVLAAIIIIIAFPSCKKEELNGKKPVNYLIRYALQDSFTVATFNYDEKYRLEQIDEYEQIPGSTKVLKYLLARYNANSQNISTTYYEKKEDLNDTLLEYRENIYNYDLLLDKIVFRHLYRNMLVNARDSIVKKDSSVTYDSTYVKIQINKRDTILGGKDTIIDGKDTIIGGTLTTINDTIKTPAKVKKTKTVINTQIFHLSDTTYSVEEGYREFRRVTYKYNTNRQIIKEFHYFMKDSSSTLARYYEYFYNSKGNIATIEEYTADAKGENPHLNSITKLEFDDKRNPYKDITFIYGYSSYSNNNITGYTRTDIFGNIDEKVSYFTVYEYNEDGYPTTEKRIYIAAGSYPKIYLFEYNKANGLSNSDNNSLK